MPRSRTLVLGITGSVGMGKTTAARAFARAGYPVFDADACVHDLLAGDRRTIAGVRRAFPTAVKNGVVDRKILGALVFADDAALGKLESLLHPRVRARQRAFVRAAKKARARLAVVDVPLLFETGGDKDVDATLVVTAPLAVQRERVLARRGMTRKRFDTIRKRQLSDASKRQRATYVVDTGSGRAMMLRQIRTILATLESQ